MAFKGRDPVRTEIVVDNRIIEHVKLFDCLGNVISYGKELDIDNKLRNCLKITGILNNGFRQQKPRKKTKIKLYNTVLLCGSGTGLLQQGAADWTVTARGGRLDC